MAGGKTLKKARTLGGALNKQELFKRGSVPASSSQPKPAAAAAASPQERPALRPAASFHGDFQSARPMSPPPGSRNLSPSRTGASILKDERTNAPRRSPGGGSVVSFADNPSAAARARSPNMGKAATARAAPGRTSSPLRGKGSNLKAQTAPGDMEQSSPSGATPSTAAPSPVTPLKSRTRTGDSTPEMIELGLGRRAKKDGLAPKPALDDKNDWYGAGERMEAQKWQKWSRLVDKNTLGPHYDYIVGDLTAHRAVEDHEQRQHDEALMQDLVKRRPSETSKPLAYLKKPDMRAAFTDRSVRMREGRGAKAAILPDEQPPNEWACHADCSCAVCKPFDLKPAGQPSHHVHYNKVPRCNKDSHPTQPHWENEVAHTFNSDKLAMALPHRDEQRESEQPPEEEEKAFKQNMGRKVKSPTPHSPGGGRMYLHRSFSEDLSASAGMFNQDNPSAIGLHNNKARQPWQGARGQSPSRSGMAYILDPQAEDPPPPSRISAARKADGHFKGGHTQHSEAISTHYNQEIFRFAEPGFVRGRSVSPPKIDAHAGVPTSQWGRAASPPSSPNARSRMMLSNSSRTMAAVMSHEAGEDDFAREAAMRRQYDSTFVELCKHTAEHYDSHKSLADSFKHSYGHATSGKMRSQMAWAEH